ncbi:TPA: hypothetical protein ACGY76_003671 [Clostridioides difficile]
MISNYSDWLTTFGKSSILHSIETMSNFDDFSKEKEIHDIKGGTTK